MSNQNKFLNVLLRRYRNSIYISVLRCMGHVKCHRRQVEVDDNKSRVEIHFPQEFRNVLTIPSRVLYSISADVHQHSVRVRSKTLSFTCYSVPQCLSPFISHWLTVNQRTCQKSVFMFRHFTFHIQRTKHNWGIVPFLSQHQGCGIIFLRTSGNRLPDVNYIVLH